MKSLNLSKLIIFIVLTLAASAITTNVKASCVSSNGVITIGSDETAPVDNNDGEGDSDQCETIPDEYKIKFYKIGLCTSDTSYNDLSSCQYILNSSAGVEHTIKYPEESPMAIPEFSIDPGTYPYFTLVVSNKLGIKHTIQYSATVEGHSSSSGKYCWTDRAGPSTYNNDGIKTYITHGTSSAGGYKHLKCGSLSEYNAASPSFTYEIINMFNGDMEQESPPLEQKCYVQSGGNDTSTSYIRANGDRQRMGLMGTGIATVNLLQQDETYATTCENSAKILWTTQLTNPFNVTEDSAFSLLMKTTDGVTLDHSNSASGNPEVHKVGANAPQLYLQITN